jgi:transposase
LRVTASSLVAEIIERLEGDLAEWGRPRLPVTDVVGTLRFFLREGVQWRELPAGDGRASGSTLRRRLRELRDTAMLPRVHAVLLRMIRSDPETATRELSNAVDTQLLWRKGQLPCLVRCYVRPHGARNAAHLLFPGLTKNAKRSCLLKSSMPIRLAPCLHQPRQRFPQASFNKIYVYRKIALDRSVEFPVQNTVAKMRNVQPVGYLPNRSASGPEVCDYLATLVCRLPGGTVEPQDGIHRKHQTGRVSPCRSMPDHCSAGNGCH